MDLKVNSNSKVKIDKNILDLFWNLCDKDTNARLNACADILHLILKKQQEVESESEESKDLKYCIERLIKGLASPRDAARLGYTLLLTEILKRIDAVQVEEILELLKKHLSVINKQDKRDIIFGQLFTYASLVRSGRLLNHPLMNQVVLSLYDLTHGKNYILNASYEILLDLFSQLTGNFKDVWSVLKKKLPSDWETCSADSLWLLLLCIRLFPDIISAKYMKNHWGSHDIFASENLNHFKRIIKQTTSCLPNLHPLCSEFLLLVKQRKDFSEIWNTVVDENLFDHEQNEKSFVGFEIIKLALRDEPTKKVLKIVLSPKFRSIFSKSYINSKHPMNSAASHLADFLCNFVKKNSVPDMQIIVLKTFLQPPSTVLLDPILKKKEVSMIIQNLLPDAVKSLCEILKSVLLNKKSNDNNDKINNLKRFQASRQIANLIAHPVMLTDTEWRLEIIQFLFLHSFFVVKESTSEIPHCENICEPLTDALRDSCMTAFFKSVNSLHIRSETQHPSLNSFLEQLLSLTVYAEQLMNAPENIEPKFSIEKIKDSWYSLKTIVHKLRKQCKKDGLVNESNAFQALFLALGLHLFQDPDDIPELLDELHICCKKSLKIRKHDTGSKEDKESEPPWIGVVIDILLSLLSKSSKHLQNLVLFVFPLFCPFIDSNALQQILDVINPRQSSEDMLVDESDNEDVQNIDFGSGSSSDESDAEADNQPIDEEFKKKVQCALGPAAENSDDESVVLSDSEMFKLDNALSEAFKLRLKSRNSQMSSEEKTLLQFRVRCLDLILAYLRSQPPMYLVLKCVEPVLAAFEFGHSKHQITLLHKSISVLQFMTKIKKFQHHNDITKSELKRLLDALIPKCHKEINMSVSQKLSSLCVFIVLCYRKLEVTDSPNKKKSSKNFCVKTYLSALETFVSSGSSHMLPNFFTNLMEACPDLAWYFIEPCKHFAFNSTARLFKKTQCLGLLSESLKYSKSQKELTNDQWLELANSLFPVVIESLKNVFETTDLKPVYATEHLNIIHTLYSIIKEKTGQSILEKHPDLLDLLTNASNGKMKKLNSKGKKVKNWIIISLGGKIDSCKKSQVANADENTADQTNEKKRKLEEVNEDAMDCVNGDLSNEGKKKKLKKNKKKIKSGLNIDNRPDSNN